METHFTNLEKNKKARLEDESVWAPGQQKGGRLMWAVREEEGMLESGNGCKHASCFTIRY